MTESHTPDEIAALTQRLVIDYGAPVSVPVEVGQDTASDLKPRSVKMTDDMDRRTAARAARLGLSKSAYIRQLIARDLAQAEHTGRPVADLARIAAELSRAAVELDRTAAELGHTA